MESDESFCGACHCFGFGDGNYDLYLCCPACGHMYLSKLDKSIRKIYLEKFPKEILDKRFEVKTLMSEFDSLTEQIGIIELKK